MENNVEESTTPVKKPIKNVYPKQRLRLLETKK